MKPDSDAISHFSIIFSAMASMASIAVAVYFIKFWHLTQDVFFALFALAFSCLAADQFVMAVAGLKIEEHGLLYWLRIAGYAFILLAIVLKNLPARKSS